jgi:hypothetical protein
MLSPYSRRSSPPGVGCRRRTHPRRAAAVRAAHSCTTIPGERSYTTGLTPMGLGAALERHAIYDFWESKATMMRSFDRPLPLSVLHVMLMTGRRRHSSSSLIDTGRRFGDGEASCPPPPRWPACCKENGSNVLGVRRRNVRGLHPACFSIDWVRREPLRRSVSAGSSS